MTIAVFVDVCAPGAANMALAPLGGESALRRVFDRCRLIPGVDKLVCIAPDSAEFDELVDEAVLSGAHIVRGPASDLLGLCARAASETGADTIVHVGADRPFIDPNLCARMLALLNEADADYSCNDLPATWPHGLDCEVFPARLLHWADALANEPEERARATAWLRFNPDLRKACLTGPGGDFAHLRWLLQWPEDLSFAEAVYEHMGERAASASASELAALCLRRPDITALNAKRNDTLRLSTNLRADFVTAPHSLAVVA